MWPISQLTEVNSCVMEVLSVQLLTAEGDGWRLHLEMGRWWQDLDISRIASLYNLCMCTHMYIYIYNNSVANHYDI